MFNSSDNMTAGLSQTPVSAAVFNSSDNLTTSLIPQSTARLPIFANIQLAVSSIGVVSNLATLITLGVNGEGLSKIIRMLFQWQAFLDCVNCLNSILLYYPPFMWSIGNEVFDTVMCHIVHTSLLYWLFANYSMRNLIIQAVERYLCICHPLRYMTLTRRHFRLAIMGTVLFDTLFTFPLFFQTRMRDGLCWFELFWDGPHSAQFYNVYAYVAVFIVSVIPTTILVVLYSLVLHTLRKRADSDLGASGAAGVIDKATKELTKSAIVVTLFFICSTSVVQLQFSLTKSGVLEYDHNSALTITGELLSVSNFVVNPFIYASFMPVYRESVKKTFFKHCKCNN